MIAYSKDNCFPETLYLTKDIFHHLEYQISGIQVFNMLQKYVNYLPGNIRYLRKKRNLLQEQMPALIGISRTTWSNYETGVSEPAVGGLLKISNFFGISLDELILMNLQALEKPAPDAGKKTYSKRIVYSANEDFSSMVRDPQVGFAYVLKELQKLREEVDTIRQDNYK
jgi:transcriptional regulator with XRE-family HTH domain